MKFLKSSIDRDYEALLRRESAILNDDGVCTAGALALVATGAELSDRTIDTIIDRLAAFAERHALTPDETQQILLHHEPELGAVL